MNMCRVMLAVQEFCQLWLNLPASEKMSEPAYQPILAGDIQESRLVAWDGRHEAKIDATEPVSESEALEKGDLVKVKGLGSRPELNGRLGRISSPTKAGERGEIFVSSGDSATPLSKGDLRHPGTPIPYRPLGPCFSSPSPSPPPHPPAHRSGSSDTAHDTAVEVFITGELLPKALRRYNLERVLADPDTQMGAQEDGNVRVIAGRYGEAIGPAKTVTQVDLWDVSIDNTEGTYQFDMMPGNNVIVFTRKGRVEVQGKPLGPQDVALMGTAGSRLLIKAIEPSKVLVLAGQPLNEPIASRGPFVMNTPEELRQAMHDFQMGRF